MVLSAARSSRSLAPHSPPRHRASDTHQPTKIDSTAVLVVDDEQANLELARTLLQSEGFAVQIATDAISAFEVLKDCDPVLILMDIQLPGMDGWELTRRLKRNAATSHIPVVALTAYGTEGDEARAREAGCAAFVAKPVSTRELPAIVRQYMRRK